MARKSFSRRVVRKIKRTLRLDEAQEIMRKEFIDSHGNKHVNIIEFKPQSPLKPDFKQTVEYKDDK